MLSQDFKILYACTNALLIVAPTEFVLATVVQIGLLFSKLISRLDGLLALCNRKWAETIPNAYNCTYSYFIHHVAIVETNLVTNSCIRSHLNQFSYLEYPSTSRRLPRRFHSSKQVNGGALQKKHLQPGCCCRCTLATPTPPQKKKLARSASISEMVSGKSGVDMSTPWRHPWCTVLTRT